MVTMKSKVSHGGAGLTTAEYEVRELDEHGDVIDVNHYETKREAMEHAEKLLTHSAAVVVELHIMKYPAHLFDEPSKYTAIATMGSVSALTEGGWLD